MKKALVLLACVALVFAVMSCEQEEQAKTAEDYFFVETGDCGDSWDAGHYLNGETPTVTLTGNTLSGYVNASSEQDYTKYVRISLKESYTTNEDGTYSADVAGMTATCTAIDGNPVKSDPGPTNIFALSIEKQTYTFEMYDSNIVTLNMQVQQAN